MASPARICTRSMWYLVAAFGAVVLAACSGSDTSERADPTTVNAPIAPDVPVPTTVTMLDGDRSVYGFILPRPGDTVGRDDSVQGHWVGSPDTPGLVIDAEFLATNAGAPWLEFDGDRPMITGADFLTCIRIAVPVTITDSAVSCGTRLQSDDWGPSAERSAAIQIDADDVVLTSSTVTCQGGGDIVCAWSVAINGDRALLDRNDLAFALGAIDLGPNSVIRDNYLHAFTLETLEGDQDVPLDPDTGAPTDAVLIGNDGVSGARVEGNFLDARYGRVADAVADDPEASTSTGGPVAGVAVMNDLTNGPATGLSIVDNYFGAVSRPFLCLVDDTPGAECVADFSHNIFGPPGVEDVVIEPVFAFVGGVGTMSGQCNATVQDPFDPAPMLLPRTLFGAGDHRIDDCAIVPGPTN